MARKTELELKIETAKMLGRLLLEKRALEKCEHSFRVFVKEAWKVVEPGTPYTPGWHIDAICLPGDSLIQTRKGLLPISALEDHNKDVLSWNHSNGNLEWKPIIHWMKSPGRAIFKIATNDGISLSLTGNHPVYVVGRGYIPAEEVRVGDRLQTVREVVREIPIADSRRILRNEVFRPGKNTSGEQVFSMSGADCVGQRVSLSPVLERTCQVGEPHGSFCAMPKLRQGGVSEQGTPARNSADLRGVLQSKVLRGFRNREEQSRLSQWTWKGGIPGSVCICEAEDTREGAVEMLPLRDSGKNHYEEDKEVFARCSPYRSEPQEQRSDESSGSLQAMPSETGNFRSRYSIVSSIERALSIPEFVYNIEVQGNNNYFADGVLVHNCDHLEALAKRDIRNLIINISPRSAKPLDVDTVVLMADGTRKRLGDIQVGESVITHFARPQQVTEVHEQGMLDCLRITTAAGRKIVSADDHPFLTPEGWIEAKSLSIGQCLGAVAEARTNICSERKDEEFSLAGYFVGDGSVSHGNANITSADLEYQHEVKASCDVLGFSVATARYRKVGQFNTDLVRLNISGGVREWLASIGLRGQNSHTKRIPEFVFRGTDHQIGLYLAAYFHCDGTLTKKSPTRKNYCISFSSVSADLLRDTQHLLLRLGIYSRIVSKVILNNAFQKTNGEPYPYFTLDIGTEDAAARFLEMVPILGRKRDRLLSWKPLKKKFRSALLPDEIVAIERVGKRECRCLTIAEDESFTANDVAVHNSTLISVMFPAWRWITAPEEKFLTASYSSSLSIRDSRKCRNLIKSEWYQKAWSNRFAISKDQNEKGRFENDKGGYRLATSVDGTNIGEGGTCMILDDPNDLNTVDSPIIRQNTLDWYDGVMSSRHIDPQTDVRLCVQQRGHMDDMTAHLLGFGDWELLSIPMEYEGPSKPTSIGWMDPRATFGELMHPDRFGPKEIAKLKQVQGPHRYAGQYQQRPSAAAGGQLKREYWNYWNPIGTDTDKVKIKIGNETIEKTPKQIPAAFEQIVQSWDMAFKDAETNDFVAGHAWGRVGANIYLLGREHGHFDFPKTLQAVRRMSVQYPCPEKLVEDKANGPAVIATLANEIPGLIPITPDGGKESRVNAISGYAEAGNIYLPNPNLYPWVKDLVDEFANFPVSVHDDDTDAMSQAARRLFDSAVNTGVPEFRVVPRINEPETACHVEQDQLMLQSMPSHWRRWIAVAPGSSGAALWICETPSKSLRVYRELSLEGADAHEAGRLIGEATLSDVRSYLRSVHVSAKWNIDVLLEREAFTPIEPIGSYAELLEHGILSFDPTSGSWEDRQAATNDLRMAKFSAQMAETDESAFDHLRDLLRFKPPDYEEVAYDRKTALKLRGDIEAFNSYMACVEGRIYGEYPKIKFASSCVQTISALGAVRRDDNKLTDEFMRALLIGISAPPSVMSAKPVREVPWTRALQNRSYGRRAV